MATACGPPPSANAHYGLCDQKKNVGRGCLKQRKDCISRKNRAVTRQKSSEYRLLYSEDFQRSKRRFLLGKTTLFDFKQPLASNIQNARNGSLFRGAVYKSSAFPPSCPRLGPAAPVRRARRGVILNEKGFSTPFQAFPRRFFSFSAFSIVCAPGTAVRSGRSAFLFVLWRPASFRRWPVLRPYRAASKPPLRGLA